MSQPTPYVVRFEDTALMVRELERVGGNREAVDIDRVIAHHDCPTLLQAYHHARICPAYWAIYRRVNLQDITPPELPTGSRWSWDLELIEES